MDLPDLIAPIYDLARKRAKVIPCHVNRASEIGHECVRFLVYARTNWQDRKPPDLRGALAFKEGDNQEETVKRDWANARIDLIEQQSALELRELRQYQITGHCDGVISVDGVGVPVEIKSMHPNIWSMVAFRGAGIYTWPEVREAFQRKPWLRKYLAQLTIYMLAKDSEAGIWVLKNKSTGELAQVNVRLDYDYATDLLAKAEEINLHIETGELPDRIPWDEELCGRCDFLHLCLPDRVGQDPIKYVDAEEIAELCAVRERLDSARREWKRADDRVKKWMKAQGTNRVALPGGWVLERKATKTGVKVSIEAPASPAGKGEE